MCALQIVFYDYDYEKNYGTFCVVLLRGHNTNLEDNSKLGTPTELSRKVKTLKM